MSEDKNLILKTSQNLDLEAIAELTFQQGINDLKQALTVDAYRKFKKSTVNMNSSKIELKQVRTGLEPTGVSDVELTTNELSEPDLAEHVDTDLIGHELADTLKMLSIQTGLCGYGLTLDLLQTGTAANQSYKTGPKQVGTKLNEPEKEQTKGGRIVRRSIRQIESDLETRLSILRNDSKELDALKFRLETYKSERAQNNEIIQNNKHIDTYETHQEALREKFSKMSEHRALVKMHKESMDRSRRRELQKQMHQKELNMGLGKSARIEKAERERKLAHLKKWFILVAVGSRIQQFYDALFVKFLRRVGMANKRQEDQKEEMEKIKHWRSAVVIQKTWHRFKKAREEEKRMTSLVIISRCITKFLLPKIRLKLKHRASEMLVKFFRESSDVNSLMKVIKTYRYKVIVCQRSIRSYLTIRNHQIKLIEAQWTQMEPLWWQKQTKLSAINASADISKTPKVRKKRADTIGVEAVFHVPATIKLRLIREDLKQRKAAYRIKHAAYRQKFSEWNQKDKKKREMMNILMKDGPTGQAQANPTIEGLKMNSNGLPYLIIFPVLLKQQDMMALIERGFNEATNAISKAL